MYSRRYQKRIKRLLWSTKYFGKNFRAGYAVRRVAVVAMACIGLLGLSEVSARVFGFRPWARSESYISDGGMEQFDYLGTEKRDSGGEYRHVTKDVPDSVPEGLKETMNETFDGDGDILVEWHKTEMIGITYERVLLTDGTTIWIDGEYESKERVEVCGYEGYYCIKGDEEWLWWDDVEYHHAIYSNLIDNARQKIIKMANSLYE